MSKKSREYQIDQAQLDCLAGYTAIIKDHKNADGSGNFDFDVIHTVKLLSAKCLPYGLYGERSDRDGDGNKRELFCITIAPSQKQGFKLIHTDFVYQSQFAMNIAFAALARHWGADVKIHSEGV